MTDPINPKIFVSYSWSSSDHIEWVEQLASTLRTHGVDTILDKWNLREGQDSYAFMESMVTDPNVQRVILICDKKYVQRADSREGGVGVEAQVISAEIYGQVDQTKFVAICREKDSNGRALLPIFMRNRIFIDLCDDADFNQGYEKLLRWCHGKPLSVAPEIGAIPNFLDEKSGPIIANLLPFERVLRSPSQNPKMIVRTAVSFLKDAVSSASDFTISPVEGEEMDERVFKSIEGLAPIISRIFKVVEESLPYDDGDEIVQAFHDFLEAVIPNLDKGTTAWSGDVTRFFAHFMFVGFLGILVSRGSLEALNRFLDIPFIKESYGGITAKTVHYEIFRTNLRSMDARNTRLTLRRLSLHADMIKQMCESIGYAFKDFIQIDFALYVRGVASGDDQIYRGWWPTSGVYIDDDHEGALPIFLRAERQPPRDETLRLIGINSRTELMSLISSYQSGAVKVPNYGGPFSRLDVLALLNAKKILESYE